MSSQHTPGPWKVNFTRLNGEVCHWHVTDSTNGSANAVAMADEEMGELRPPTELEANARLIAAAPDLLDALKLIAAEAAEGAGSTGRAGWMGAIARVAIANATGSAA